MGYPMTYQRMLRRNGLATGDSRSVPLDAGPMVGWNLEAVDAMPTSMIRSGIASANRKVAILLDDLRRLERDATDEAATARHIADRTGVDVDMVAAVLKEFISW